MPGKRDVYWGYGCFEFLAGKILSFFRENCHDRNCMAFRIFQGFSDWIGQFIGQLKIRVLPVNMRVLGYLGEKVGKIHLRD
nr:hypothetical protein [uncultured Acetatifactor sp.]